MLYISLQLDKCSLEHLLQSTLLFTPMLPKYKPREGPHWLGDDKAEGDKGI